jgi:acyl dehydratase
MTTLASIDDLPSLVPDLLGAVFVVQSIAMGVNYGANTVRFPSPVPVGAGLHHGITLAGVEEVGGGVQAVPYVTLEVNDPTKPSCAAQVVFRFYR